MRIRSIKPEWLEDEKLAASSDTARLLSVALILLADDHGRGRANHLFLASRTWPYGDAPESLRKVSGGLPELERIGFIYLYEVEGQVYFEIRNWLKHQKISHVGRALVPTPPESIRRRSGGSPEVLRPDQDQETEKETEGRGKGPRERLAKGDHLVTGALEQPRSGSPPLISKTPDSDSEEPSALEQQLAAIWERETRQRLGARSFERLLGQLCDTADRRRVKPEVLFARAVQGFTENCESRKNQPVLSWFIDQLGEWLAVELPNSSSNGSTKHHTMSPLTPEQERDRQAFMRGER